MYCSSCGNQIRDDALFCPFCGRNVKPLSGAPRSMTAEQEGQATGILVLGILSLAIGGIVGIVLGCIGKNKADALARNGVVLTGKAKVGSILSRVGIAVGIVTAVLIVLYVIFCIAAGWTLGTLLAGLM